MFAVALLISLAAQPAEFGRFGRIHEDGLLTLLTNPTGFTAPIAIGHTKVAWQAGEPKVTAIDRSRKHLSFSPIVGQVREIQLNLTEPYLLVSFEGRSDLRIFPAGYRAQKVGGDVWLLHDSGKELPVRIHPLDGTRIEFDGDRVTLSGRHEPTIQIGFPYGLDLRQQKPDAAAALPLDWSSPVSAPVMVSGARPGFQRFKIIGKGPRIAVPPVLAQAIESGSRATILGAVNRTGRPTLAGPLWYVRGSELLYDLPIPPIDDRVLIAPEPTAEETGWMRKIFGSLDMKWATNAVDLCYSRAAPAVMAGDLLPGDLRTKALAALRWNEVFTMPPYRTDQAVRPWMLETEPSTGLTYPWTYKIDGEGPYKYDIEWGNALPVYGTYQRSLAEPIDVKGVWSDLNRVFEFMDAATDWAWMTTCNADHGYSTGTGDPMCAYYVGLAARLKLARLVGDTKVENQALNQLCHVGIASIARFGFTKYARDWGLIGPTSVALGFHEREGVTRVPEGTTDPWGPTTLLSGSGAQPEMFGLYLSDGRRGLEQFLSDYERAYPNWKDGNHKYPFQCTYNGNSGYVNFPHIYARLRLGESTAKLTEMVRGTMKNPVHAWVGANVIAEIANRRAPGYLTRLENVTVHSARFDRKTNRVTLKLRPRQPGKPASFEFRSQGKGRLGIPSFGQLRGSIWSTAKCPANLTLTFKQAVPGE